MQVWGEAYKMPHTSQLVFSSWLGPEHEIPMDHAAYSLNYLHNYHPSYVFSQLEIKWPSARAHPYFYVGIYAAIALTGVVVNSTSAITQYSGALRASRTLFQRLLVGVVRATMRWHDVTPQG